MRPLILLLTASLLCGSCTCNNCPAQGRTTYGPQYGVKPGTYPVQPAAVFDPNKKVSGHHDAAGNLMYRSGQVIDFPTGANRLHLNVVVGRNFRADANQYKVAQWFTSGAPAKDGTPRSANARLRTIQDSVAFHYIFNDDPNFVETARADVMGTAVPQVSLTGPDGRIKRDGGAGCYLDPTYLAGLSGPDEVADLIIAAAEGFNEKPNIQGLIRRGVDTIGAGTFCPKCNTPTGGGPCPNCTPTPPSNPPNSGTVPSKIPGIVPSKRSSIAGAVIVLTSLGLLGAGALAVGIFKPFNRKAV